MRHRIFLVTALILAGCSQKPESGAREGRNADAAMSEAAAGPGIEVTAAPGVAFAYEYLFRLPGQGIARAQEAHAQACEKLGIARCRISGMHYAVGEAPADVTATLNLKLDPTIARKFGTEGIDAIVKAGGSLGGADITGVDAGGAITAIDRAVAGARAELQEIDQKLATLRAKAPERFALAQRATEIRQQLAERASSRSEQVDSLATTPMTFRYVASSAIPGFDSGAPLYTGYLIGKQSLFVALTVLIVVIGVGAPWLLFALLIGWLYRVSGLRALRRRWKNADPA
ncbi:hypothetical protein [Sphingomonas sp. 28-63-12]|uniref:hypothetical protein n=1 Tax=Sphingomonas sp. 28-63-12 TaxID=1970434 RepID=UPI000BD10E56|nr:MAG: hypothetical protein B7Y47_13845 [Sphingomonas sp. 28-63-12]